MLTKAKAKLSKANAWLEEHADVVTAIGAGLVLAGVTGLYYSHKAVADLEIVDGVTLCDKNGLGVLFVQLSNGSVKYAPWQNELGIPKK